MVAMEWRDAILAIIPRVTCLGVMGVLFDVSYLTITGLRLMIFLIVYLGATIGSVIAICDASTTPDGSDDDLLVIYIYIPFICQVVALVALMGWAWIRHTWDIPTWAAPVGIHPKTESKWQVATCLLSSSPHLTSPS